MPAARYWRVTGIDTYGGGDLELTEFALYEAGVRVDTGPTAPIAPTTGTLAALSDDSNASTCAWTALRYSLPGFALVYDLGSAKLVDEIRIGAGALQSEFPFSFRVQTSSDGVTWASASGYVGLTWPGAAGTLTITGDASINPSSLLLHLDGANGSTVFTDSSYSNKAVTRNGAPVISTAQSMFGGSSALFNGGTDGLQYSGSDLNFTGDYTVEGFIYPTASHQSATYTGRTLFSLGLGANSVGNRLTLQLNYLGGFQISHTGVMPDSYTVSVPLNAWTHVALCRAGTTTSVFAGGALALTSTAVSFALTGGLIRLAQGDSGFGSFIGYMDEVRVTPGLALYAAPFTPPTQAFLNHTGITGQRAPLGQFRAPSPPLPAPYAPSPVGVVYRDPAIRNHRRDFEGHGRIVGTTKEKALPSNTPLRRHVFCMDMLTGTIVGDLWSDAATGAYVFNDLDLTRRYTVYSYDHTNAYRAVIADNLQPELMP